MIPMPDSSIEGFLSAIFSKRQGGGSGGDLRIKKLEAAPTLHEFIIGDGWSVRVKIADDIDNVQEIGNKSSYYRKWDTAYFCVYYNGVLKYAVGKNLFHTAYQETYYTDAEYEIQEWDNYVLTSAEIYMYGGSEIYSYICGTVTQTYHGVGGSGTAYGPYTQEDSFSEGFSGYNQASNGVMLLNDGVDFKTAYQDFYAACKKNLPIK